MADFIVRSNPLLQALPKKSLSVDRIRMRNKNASAHNPRTIQDGSVVTIGNPGSTYGAGVLDWATYIAEFKLSKRLLGQIVGNPAMVGQLFAEEIKDAVADLGDRISSDLFGGDATDGLVGLQSIMGNTNTYAGIDRSVAGNAYWRGLNVSAGADAVTAGALSTSIFYRAEKSFFDRNKYELFSGRVSPTLFTSKSIQLGYKELFESISSDALGSSHFVNQANSSGQFGKTMVGFSGYPLIPEPNLVKATTEAAGTNRIYVMDTGSVFLATLTPNDDSEVVRMQQLDPSKAPSADGLRVEIEILGNQGEFVSGYVKTYVQLVCQEPPRAGVVITNVAESF